MGKGRGHRPDQRFVARRGEPGIDPHDTMRTAAEPRHGCRQLGWWVGVPSVGDDGDDRSSDEPAPARVPKQIPETRSQARAPEAVTDGLGRGIDGIDG